MSKTLHRFSVALSLCTLFLIFVGGMVTSTGAGLSVPDWPLSYGRLMPPMIGGIFYEHGHRMVASAVGLLTVILAILAALKEPRGWVKRATWVAVALVILQGVLGGMTVLFRLPKPISIAHACLAQTFFCVVVALAVWTSRFWTSNAAPRAEPENKVPLHRLAMALFVFAWLQLVLGALLRHTGRALPLHVGGAVAIALLAVWSSTRIWKYHPDARGLKILSVLLPAAIAVQIGLGVSSYLLLIHQFDVIPPPLWSQVAITLHVATGALILALSLITALMSYRTRPAHSAPIQTTLSDYLTLTKPGISFMAGITALAGFVLGSAGDVQWVPLIHTCIGTLLAAGGAGCLNMLLERDVDARMIRTKTRPLPSGRLNPGEVLLLGTFLSTASVVYLAWTVNLLTALIAGLTVGIYLYLYTPLKKVSGICVTVGAVAGALPPVMGWTAATGRLGLAPLVLFGILFFWQFPHFLSLAWLYKDDYERGGLHMVGPEGTTPSARMLATSVLLLAVSALPTWLGLTGNIYLVAALALGGAMTLYAAQFFITPSRSHAKRVFLYSLLYMPLLVVLMLINTKAT